MTALDIEAIADSLLALLKIHSYSESTPGLVMNLKTLSLIETTHIPAMPLTSGYHSIFGVPAICSPYIPLYVVGIMDLKKAEELRRVIHSEKRGKSFLELLEKAMNPGMFTYGGIQYMTISDLKALDTEVKVLKSD